MGIKVFITGAGGYLGSVLATQLARLPEISAITGIVNHTLPRDPLPDKVNLVKMDIRSPEIADAMSGYDFVIHSAFIVQWSANMPAAPLPKQVKTAEMDELFTFIGEKKTGFTS